MKKQRKTAKLILMQFLLALFAWLCLEWYDWKLMVLIILYDLASEIAGSFHDDHSRLKQQVKELYDILIPNQNNNEEENQ